MNSDSIADPELAKLWDDAQTALNNLSKFLFPNGEKKWLEDHYGENDIEEEQGMLESIILAMVVINTILLLLYLGQRDEP